MPAAGIRDPSLRQTTAKALDGFLREWRTTARQLVTRRDHLIRLGLAERHTGKDDEQPDPFAGMD